MSLIDDSNPLYPIDSGGVNLNDPNTDWGGLFGTDWLTQSLGGLGGYDQSGGGQMFLDSLTGDLLTLQQVLAIDPTFQYAGGAAGGGYSGTSDVLGSGGSQETGPYGYSGTPNTSDAVQQQQISGWAQALGMAPAALTALLGLGTLGVAGAGLFGAGNQPGTATRTRTDTPNALNNPQVQQLLGSPGTTAGGTAGAPGAYTGGTGLQGASGQAAANLQGPQGLLQGQMSAIPQLDPAIQAAIGQNALGFSQGNVPTLNNPQAQEYFQNILGGQNAYVDYQTGNSLEAALQNLRARGFAGGSEIFREGAPAAAMGPVVAQGNAQKAMNLGNVNAQQLAYATQLPKLGADLSMAQLNQQNVPFTAYNQAAQTQSQIPLELLRLLTGQGGRTETQLTTGAAPNLLQSLMAALPAASAGGSFLNSPSVTGTPANSMTGAPGTPSLYAQLAGLFG